MKAMFTRRGALLAIGGFAGCFALGGAAQAFAGQGQYLRPPGGQDELRLRALCIKCDRCRSVCPQLVVGLAPIEDGLLAARTPVLDFHQGYCDFCGLCQRVCPTGALVDFDPASDALGIAQVDAALCLAYSKGCDQCGDSCPYGALSFNEKGYPAVDEGLCNGCGRCVDACRANVYGFYTGRGRGIEVWPVAEERGRYGA